ncbi:MAG: hypothetical protein U1E67_15115 [Hyphomicrobiales bacterium]
MYALKKTLRVAVLGICLLAASGPAIDHLGLTTEPFDAAYAFKKLGGADKIGWAKKFRAWCKENKTQPQCDYVNSLVSAKCVKTDVKNFKDACSAS